MYPVQCFGSMKYWQRSIKLLSKLWILLYPRPKLERRRKIKFGVLFFCQSCLWISNRDFAGFGAAISIYWHFSFKHKDLLLPFLLYDVKDTIFCSDFSCIFWHAKLIIFPLFYTTIFLWQNAFSQFFQTLDFQTASLNKAGSRQCLKNKGTFSYAYSPAFGTLCNCG